MTSTENTATGSRDTLSLEFELKHPKEKVWRALTDPTLLAEWLLPVIEFKLEEGAAFTYKTQPYPGWDGIVNCKMLEIEPHKKLKYTWGVPFLETVVTFTLAPTASGTRLSIEQSGFKPDQQREFGGARYGWNMMTGKLVELLERV
ncbi:MAG TPA: SRPBCC domain-containing protein [Polyangia bacterium]